MVCKQPLKILGKKHKPFRCKDLLRKHHLLQKIIAAGNKIVNISKVSRKLNKISIDAIIETQKCCHKLLIDTNYHISLILSMKIYGMPFLKAILCSSKM